MAEETDGTAAEQSTAPAVKRYPVAQPDGSVRSQLILVTGTDDDGKVRGVPLAYEDQAAAFNADELA